jgi:hypothetical protein
MKTLFYRTGGTMNFRWQAVLMVGIDGPTAEASLIKAGYPAIWADEAPQVFEPEGAIWPPHIAADRERKLRKAITEIAEYAETYKPARPSRRSRWSVFCVLPRMMRTGT